MFCKRLIHQVHFACMKCQSQPQSPCTFGDTVRLLSSFNIQACSLLGVQLKEIEEIKYFQEHNEQVQDLNQPGAALKSDSTNSVVKTEVTSNKRVQEFDVTKTTSVKYPLKGMGLKMPVYKDSFENIKDYLQSLNICTDELLFYPDVQEMSKEDINICIKRLRENQIHVIFSLFLIQRMFVEIVLERNAKRESSTQLKQWFKLRNGMYRVTSIRYVVLYLELCNLLEEPFLDPVQFIEKLAEVGVYDHLQTIVNKTRKLRSVGAEPKDILDNLQLYLGSAVFNAKIKLYQNVIGEICRPFPVKLFLCQTVTDFKEKLQLGDELKEISKLLNVKEADFLMCWSYKTIHTKSLVYKIQMCLQAGLPQADIFNNIGILDRITVNQCHLVTKSLCQSGQPGSVFVFKQLENNIRYRAKKDKGHNSHEPDWTTGESGVHNSSSEPFNMSSLEGTKGLIAREKQRSSSKTIPSSNKWRMEVFKLVAHLLNLDKPIQRAMYKADINIDPTQLIDVTRNLEFLLSQKFTREIIAQCPIVLAHPSDSLLRVYRDVGRLMKESVTIVNSSSSSSSLSSSDPRDIMNQSEFTSAHGQAVSVSEDISQSLLADPVSHLNVLQYFLEKETNFSLNFAQTQSVVEFLN